MNSIVGRVTDNTMDKFTIRGLIYSGISFCGLGYELVFSKPPRLFLIVMYGIVFLIGMICIFYIKETPEES